MIRKIYFLILMFVTSALISYGQNTVTIIIDNGMMAIADATVTIDGYSGSFDPGMGEWTFNLPAGDHDVQVTAPGYADMTETISVSSTATFFYIHMQTAYATTIIIDNGMMLIADATVTIDGYSGNFDPGMGEWTFNLPAGDHDVQVTAPGYADMSETISVSSTATFFYIHMQTAYNLTFIASDGIMALSGVDVTVDGVTKTTNIDGEAMYTGMVAGTYGYEASKSGYVMQAGTTTITNADVQVDLIMSMGYTVNFTVTDDQNVVAGALITFNGTDLTSDENGTVAYADVIDGSYDYSVTMAGYSPATGTVVVEGVDVTESVTLTAVYNVKFSVTDGTSALAGAAITLNGVESTTDAVGEANYTDMLDGVYNYTVALTGYIDVTGSVTVAGADILEDIFLDIILGFEDLNLNSNISFYPNPVTNKINIDFSSTIDKLSVVIISTAGKNTYLGDFVNRSNLQLDLSAFDSGIYLLKIISADNVSTARIIIE